jgi:mono/diheme cytochrome c family protein
MRRLGGVVALLSVVALGGCDVLDPMMKQQKVKPYRPSPFDADGIAMRAPPAGVVAAGGAIAAEVGGGAGADGKALPRIPVPVTPELLAVGRKKFDINCAVCHGLLGDGDSLVAKNMSQRPPPSLHQRVWAEDGRYFQVVTHGFGVMPSYAAALTIEERGAVVAYVRALQLSQRARIEQASADDRARLEREQRELPR